jgi:hypothetical protein
MPASMLEQAISSNPNCLLPRLLLKRNCLRPCILMLAYYCNYQRTYKDIVALIQFAGQWCAQHQ